MATEKQIESNVSTGITEPAPYYDDFLTEDSNGLTPHDKNFLRILFKPGTSIQARELNQLQTALQSQVDKLGRGIYKNNTRVLGGEVSSDHGLQTVTVTVGGNVQLNELNELQGLIGTQISNNATFGSATVSAYVVGVQSISNNDYTLFLRYTKTTTGTGLSTSSTGTAIHTATNAGDSTSSQLTQTRRFSNASGGAGDTIYTSGGATVGTVQGVGRAARFSISEGVFYTKGSFVYKEADEIFVTLPAISDTEVEVYDGQLVLTVVEKIFSASGGGNKQEDATLFDNSIDGTNNTGQPGADRYSIDLVLRLLTDNNNIQATNQTVVEPFLTFGQETIKLLDIIDNEPSGIQTSSYSRIGDALATRTFEESGNYSLRPFKVSVREHLNDSGNGGRFTANQGGDSTKFIVEVEPSVAYIAGRRIALTSKASLTVNKPRNNTTGAKTINFQAKQGNYIEGVAIRGNFDSTKTYSLYLSKDDSTLSTLNIGTHNQSPFANAIGTCKVSTVDFDGTFFRAYITNISMNAGFELQDARFLAEALNPGVSDVVTNFQFDAGRSGPGFILKEVGQSSLVFPTGVTGVSNVTNVNYIIRTVADFTASASSADGHALTISSGTNQFFSDNPNDYIVIDQTNGQTIRLKQDAVPDIDSGLQQITFSTASALTASRAYKIIHPQKVIGASNYTYNITKNQNIAVGSSKYTPGQIVTVSQNIHTINSIVDGGSAVRTNDWEVDFLEFDNDFVNGSSKLIYRGPDLSSTGLDTARSYTVNADVYTVGTGVGTINSYNHADGAFTGHSTGGTTRYSDIHSHNNEFHMGDAIDFRLLGGGTQLDPNSLVQASVDSILPRIDCLILTKDGSFKIINGQHATNPVPPPHPSETLKIANLYLPPFIDDVNDIQVETIYNRRYTMKDINRLEDRIENLEYYTSLNRLELEAANKQVSDNDGLKFRNGILVDAFTGHNVGNPLDAGYRCAVDSTKGELRPLYSQENFKIKARAVGSNVTFNNGRIPADSYDGAPPLATTEDQTAAAEPSSRITAKRRFNLIDQPYASVSVNVNPYAISAYIGDIELSPSSDEWKSTKVAPDVIIDLDSNYDTLLYMLKQDESIGTVWGEAVTNWTGSYPYTYTTTKKKKKWYGKTKTYVHYHQASLKTGYKYRDGEETYIKTGTNKELVGDLLVDLSYIPFIRSRVVYFAATNLKPNTRHIPYLDDIDISQYTASVTESTYNTNRYPDSANTQDYDPSTYGVEVAPSSAITAGSITTDAAGDAWGYFVIPNNDSLKFKCGELTFMLLDSVTPDINNGDSYGKVNYFAQGTIETKQKTFTSTKTAELAVRAADRLYEYGWRYDTRTGREYRDPLAQSFLIGKYETGVFVSDIDLYFDTKDPNIPVNIYIVTCDQGIPSQTVVPYSKVKKLPAAVNADPNGATATNFRFQQPVYLSPGIEYAIVVASNATGNGEDILDAQGNAVHGATGYKLWVAEVGGTDVVNTDRVIKKNPYAGVFFKSQNASTWTEDQNKDFKFTLRALEFMTAAQENTGLARQFIPYEVVLPKNVAGTSLTTASATTPLHKGKNVTGFMILSTENNIPDTDINYIVRIGTESHNVVANEIVELENAFPVTADGSIAGNMSVSVLMSTRNKFVTPMISLDRFSLVTFANDVTALQSGSAANDEELARNHGKSCTARYITKQVNLDNSSTALDVYAKVNRPTGAEVRAYVRFASGTAQANSPGEDDFNFIKLDSSKIPFNDSGEFSEVHFKKDFLQEAASNSPGGASVAVSEFNAFTLKLCMGTSNTAKVPRIKELRAIATA